MYHKIYIIGAPGSGKSYIARLLSLSLNLQAHELDHLYWDPNFNRYGIATDVPTRTKMLNDILAEPAWIMEGIYHDWTTPCFEQADVIVLLKTRVWVRHWRLIRRYFQHRRKSYSGKRETFMELIRLLIWNHRYQSKELPQVMQAVSAYEDKLRIFDNSSAAMTAVIRPV
jgi:adenylate kinase family enzyme